MTYITKNISKITNAFNKYTEVHRYILFYSIAFSILASISSSLKSIPSWSIWLVFFGIFQFIQEDISVITKISIVLVITISFFLLLGSEERKSAREVFNKRFSDDNAFFLFIFEIYMGTILFTIGSWILSML